MNGITYAAIDKVLKSLGFDCRVLRNDPPARWYEHAQTGAIISIPLRPVDEQVDSSDLAAVRGTLEVYGIVDPLKLGTELQRAS